MDNLVEMVMSRVGHLLDRGDGPLHFRLVIMPLVVTFLAFRAGIMDAREGQPPFFRTLLLKPVERPRLVRSGLRDVGKIIIVAVVLDTTYQLLLLRAFYLGELLVVVMASAILPYLVVRSAVSILMRRIDKRTSKPAKPSEANPKEESEGRPASTPDTGCR